MGIRLKLKNGLLVWTIVFNFVVMVATAHAQQTNGFIESYNKVSDEGAVPQLNVYVRGPLKGRLGWSLWTLTSKPYSEAYAGLTFAPAEWIEVSGGLGLESADNPFRVGGSVWVGRGRWSLLSIHEHGGSGYWYKYISMVQITKTVAVGLNSARFLGTGPYAEKKFDKIVLWCTYAVCDNRGVVGIRFNF